MTTTNTSPRITLESATYLDARIQDKQEQILIAKQRLMKLEVELSHLKKQKSAAKRIGGIREQLRFVMHPG